MSQDKRNDRPEQHAHDADDSMARARKDLAEGNYVGKGMTSPDSTQVPLSAETGEPDERAISGDTGKRGADRDASREGRDAPDRSSR
jgi:hypothetical protein